MPATARACVPARPLAGAIAACAAQFLVGVDGVAVAIALPAMQRDLDAAPIDARWILTAREVERADVDDRREPRSHSRRRRADGAAL